MANLSKPRYLLTGINPLAYMGVEPYTPPDLVIENRSPTTNDSNFNIGSLWVVRVPNQVWMLVNLSQGVATWVPLYPGGGGGTTSFNTQSGTATPMGGVINIYGTNVMTTSGSGNTVSVTLTNGANGEVLIGGGSDPAWALLTAGSGITITPGANSITISASSPSSVTITGDSGTPAVGPNIELTGGASGAKFIGSGGNTLTESFNFLNIVADSSNTTGYIALNNGTKFLWAGAGGISQGNIFLGISSGGNIGSVADNTAVGNISLQNLLGGNKNSSFGSTSMASMTDGSLNTALGYESSADLTTGSYNTSVGSFALSGPTTSAYNVAIGMTSSSTGSGSAYTLGESNNILITNNGVNGESNVTRIGKSGSGTAEQNKCFIGGINGVNLGNTASIVTNVGDQLGTATITGGTGIAVTATANTITISESGSGVNPAAGCNSFLYQSNNQAFSFPGSGPILFGQYQVLTESYDVGSNWYVGDGGGTGGNPATFTAPATGVYVFGMQVTFAITLNTASTPVWVGVVNSVTSTNYYIDPLYITSALSGTQGQLSCTGSVQVNMNSGDVVSFYFQSQSTVSALTINGAIGLAKTFYRTYIWSYRIV